MLCYLAARPGQVVAKEELLKNIWAGTYVTKAVLKVCVRAIREALGEEATAPQYLETIGREGYRFRGEGTGEERYPAAEEVDTRLRWMVGRQNELAQLQHWLRRAEGGVRQLIFLTGEPGIGKTTVVEQFLADVRTAGRVRIGRGQCIEQHGQGEAYLPVLEALGRLCREPGGERLLALLSQHAPTWLVQMPALLSAAELEVLQRKVLGATRERMLREMAEALEVLTAERALVLVLEDLQWSDPSTLELLGYVAQRRERARLLVLGTYRPADVVLSGHPLKGLKQELQAHGQCEELRLELLPAADVTAYLAERFPATSFPQELGRQIHHRTEGNALFMVNVVEELLRQGTIVEEQGRWELKGEVAQLNVPDTLRQLIEKQITQLREEEQRVLEVASIAGTEFAVAAVAAGLRQEGEAVEEVCEEVAWQGHFLAERGIAEWPDGTVSGRYGFRHALYQSVLYERIAEARQVRLHQRIGEREEAGYGNRAGEIAAELALHFERGRDYGRAIQYLQQAAQTAIQRSANAEAIRHLTKGLELLKTLPDTPERTQRELTLQIALGVPLTATKGYAAPEVESAYARARELCRLTGETPQLIPMLRGLWQFYFVRGETSTAHELATQLLRLAERTQDPVLLLTAYQALGLALFTLGELQSARVTLEQGIALDKQQPNRFRGFIQSPAVNCLSYDAWTLWYLGYPDQALQRSHEALTLAQELAQPLTMAFALYWAATVYWYRGEGQAARERAEALLTLASEHGFRHFLAQGAIMRGWVLAEQGQVETGLALTQRGMAGYQASGAGAGWPRYLSWLAEAHRKAGKVEEGLTVLVEALEMANKTDQRVYETELHRLKGELTLQKFQVSGSKFQFKKTKRQKAKISNPQSPIPSTQHPTPSTQAEAEAEACFHKAIEVARRQSAKSLELRAVMSLSRLWQQQGKRREAHEMLAEIYGWFTEGFDTKDLQEAKALLEQLS